MARPLALGVPVLFGLSLLAGCSDSYPAKLRYPVRTDLILQEAPSPPNPPSHFDPPGELEHIVSTLDRKYLKFKDPNELTAQERAEYQAGLDSLFGTPAAPIVSADAVGEDVVADLMLEPERLAYGSRLYRRHCLHCHGLAGEGRGPTAPWINPHPRDYRYGKFKFTSSSQSAGMRKPRRADLLRTLEEGIDGSSMPSFRLLPQDQLEALVSYVIHLSIRGQAEAITMSEGPDEGETVATTLGSRAKRVAKYWWDASFAKSGGKLKYAIEPAPYPKYASQEEKDASIERGFRLFTLPGAASCISCHRDFGRQSLLYYDEWGTIVRPLDLTSGIYRGGRRPIDLYYRIHSGITGTPMPEFASALQDPKQMWDLVNFVQALPYPQMLPPKIRARVYAEP
jgi:mono/diheme cytochrome c family protein